MARWEPNARLRLVRAAIDLFAEQGYDSTTVAEIAERAGLTKTTFFRYFPDKREVLFAGQEHHTRLFADGIAAAPEGATPLEAVAVALETATAAFTPEQRSFGPQLQAVIEANGELRERSVFKMMSISAATTEALRKRGVPEPTADVAAYLGALAFDRAWARWISLPGDPSFPELAREELQALRAATANLG